MGFIMKRDFILFALVWIFVATISLFSQEWVACNSGLPKLNTMTIVSEKNILYVNMFTKGGGIYIQ